MVTANLNQKFLSGAGQVSIDITAPDTQPDVLAAFVNNTAFRIRRSILDRSPQKLRPARTRSSSVTVRAR